MFDLCMCVSDVCIYVLVMCYVCYVFNIIYIYIYMYIYIYIYRERESLYTYECVKANLIA